MNNGDFFERGLCSGNYNSLFILPDGNVTMCEELYWNKKFLLGNVQENTLLEIWNSEKAHSLFYIPQEAFPDDSFCSKCPDFDRCRSVRQVCYKEIIKQYGSDKWYYPDVNCPKKYCKQCE
jgi:radical SAM protein with 4Fe4S-binding SPASM domain